VPSPIEAASAKGYASRVSYTKSSSTLTVLTHGYLSTLLMNHLTMPEIGFNSSILRRCRHQSTSAHLHILPRNLHQVAFPSYMRGRVAGPEPILGTALGCVRNKAAIHLTSVPMPCHFCAQKRAAALYTLFPRIQRYTQCFGADIDSFVLQSSPALHPGTKSLGATASRGFV
jgi:hypothetical protein